jgi:branched-chain amino acid transport system ATP-binding protein
VSGNGESPNGDGADTTARRRSRRWSDVVVSANGGNGEEPTEKPIFLTAEDLAVRFGGIRVDAVSLEVPGGEIIGIIGPNGAGKTTLFDLIADTTTIRPGVSGE